MHLIHLTLLFQNLNSREVLSVIGDVVSIISLLLTIFVYYNVRKLREHYMFRARAPEIIRRLLAHSSNLANYLNTFMESLPQIDLELRLAEVQLRSLGKKLRGQPKKSVRQLLKSIKAYDINEQGDEELRRVYVELMKVIEEVKEHRKDLDWEK